MFTTNNAPQIFTYQKSTTETVDGSVKHVQSKQQRHQKDVIDVVVVFSSATPAISHTLLQCPHFRLREGKRK